VADIMTSYWTNFAKTGDPNGPGLAHWPPYDAKSRQILRLDANPKAEAETNRARYELQDVTTAKLQRN
jgi:para-nitrobenzyl esterase